MNSGAIRSFNPLSLASPWAAASGGLLARISNSIARRLVDGSARSLAGNSLTPTQVLQKTAAAVLVPESTVAHSAPAVAGLYRSADMPAWRTDRMMRLIIGLYAIPALLVIVASVTLLEPISVFLVGVLAGTVTVVMTGALMRVAYSNKHSLWPVVAGATACLACIASVTTIHWPLRVAFYFSQSSLNQLAEDVRAGQSLMTPARVGLFTIVETQVSRHGIVCFWVDANPGGKTGFVQCGPDHVPFNLWSMLSLNDRWQFVSED